MEENRGESQAKTPNLSSRFNRPTVWWSTLASLALGTSVVVGGVAFLHHEEQKANTEALLTAAAAGTVGIVCLGMRRLAQEQKVPPNPAEPGFIQSTESVLLVPPHEQKM